jgi:hypothetical protein
LKVIKYLDVQWKPWFPLRATLAEETMKEFRIKSSDSDLELILSDIHGDYFKARIASNHINSVREVYAYTDAYGFADMMESLATHEKGGHTAMGNY